MKKIMFIIILYLIMIPSVKSYCDEDEMIRLQKIANNITMSYEHNAVNNTFNVTFSNITRQTYIEVNNQIIDKDFEYVFKNQKSGEYKFNIYSNTGTCERTLLLTKYVSLPYYNNLYNTEVCSGIENYKYCSKWLKDNISEQEKIKQIKNYKSLIVEEITENKIENKESILDKIRKSLIDIYVNYYFIILPVIISILCLLIYIKDKKDSLF